MKKNIAIILILFNSFFTYGQSIDGQFSLKKMKIDLEIFKKIAISANSGLYKYRSKAQIDSIYNWANNEIEKLNTYSEFFNLISTISDFEGSCHNEITLPKKYVENLRKEIYGYFPFPIKWIDGKWVINIENKEIPLGAEIISINNQQISQITPKLYKYYTTDGYNITGKRIGLRTHFSKYYRINFGLTNTFNINYIRPDSNQIETKTVKSVGYKTYYKNFANIHSLPLDKFYYAVLKENQKYKYKQLDSLTGILTIHTFDIGNETTVEHKKYKQFLDSVFNETKSKKIKNLIVDVRNNGGGNDPNDLITYSFLTDRNFQENKEAWISFKKIPFLKYYDTKIPFLIRPLFVGKFNKEFQKIYPLEKNGRYYQDKDSEDHQIRKPNTNAFNGNIYLLISPEIASAGSLFAAMFAGNKNTITIGEETMGGYYGHNGHAPLSYKLPKSGIITTFSVVNLNQDVPEKSSQKYGFGIIPDYQVSQSFDDFISNVDTQMNFTLKLIQKK
jgi:hypothetical protein